MKHSAALKFLARALLSGVVLFALSSVAQVAPEPTENVPNDPDHIAKLADDALWRLELGDIATVDTFRYTGLPRTAHATSPMILYAYSFVPKALDTSAQHPLIVLVHGGVHSNFETGGPANAAHIVRELTQLGYVIVAPEYRGSTGYGPQYQNAIDYGGKENDDVLAARAWMLQKYPFLDPSRVGIVGWSHGGMIALMNVFLHPEAYACAFAGEPVSDLTIRATYNKTLQQTLAQSLANSVGRSTVSEEVYRQRSPDCYASKLRKPLLVHGNTSDEVVHIDEIEHLIAALKAAGKNFDSKIYTAAPGGHHFNRIDSKLARDSRQEIYAFLNRYLHP